MVPDPTHDRTPGQTDKALYYAALSDAASGEWIVAFDANDAIVMGQFKVEAHAREAAETLNGLEDNP